jgi:TPR repeat protein
MMFDFNKYKSLDIEILLLKAQHNDLEAQLYLALAYYHGNGVEKNIDKAHYWLEQAGKTASGSNTEE